MPYSKQIFKKASDIVAKRRLDAQQLCRQNHDKCVLLFPEIAQLEKEMASSALAVTKALEMKDKAADYIAALMKKNLSSQQKIREILKANDLPEDYLVPHYFCKKCDDTGFVDGIMCDCLKECMKITAVNDISDKLPLKDNTFEKFDLSYYSSEMTDYHSSVLGDINVIPRKKMESILNFCKEYAEDFNNHADSLLFTGETGLGKTHLSLAIAGKVIERGFSVIYGSAQNLLNMLEDEKFGRGNLDYSVEQSLLGCDLLIIDDLGSEFSTQFTVSAIYNIINTRLLERKPVIISTNFSFDDMEKKYSPRVASRIYGNYRHLIFFGRDIRQLKSQY
ncbi:MAG: ATP-binding protein [Clostridia bacterium]|nr:ATP-binding protein [Clostridia bacterium]